MPLDASSIPMAQEHIAITEEEGVKIPITHKGQEREIATLHFVSFRDFIIHT